MDKATPWLIVAGTTLLVIGLFLVIFSLGLDEERCPDYGEVPVSVDGGDIICVPWEHVEQFNQFEN